MGKQYDINEVIRLRDQEKLKWKEIEEIIQVSYETLRKAYKRTKEGKTSHEANPNSYKCQKKRGVERKIYFINKMGGCCSKCGYKDNIAALDFHHINPEEKGFQVDMRRLSNTSMDKLQEELNKCVVLCARCHREIHNPELQGLLDS